MQAERLPAKLNTSRLSVVRIVGDRDMFRSSGWESFRRFSTVGFHFESNKRQTGKTWKQSYSNNNIICFLNINSFGNAFGWKPFCLQIDRMGQPAHQP